LERIKDEGGRMKDEDKGNDGHGKHDGISLVT